MAILVGHGTRRAENTGFHAKNRGSFLFQLIYGWVLAKNIIAYFGAHHGIHHARRWFGYGIAAQVDELIALFQILVSVQMLFLVGIQFIWL